MEMWFVFAGILSLLLCIAHWFYIRRYPSFKGKLPPGSMGLPILGETLQFFTPYTTSDVSPFIRKRMNRYGSVFRTRLVGRPIIISTDPELNHFIFQQEGKLFQGWYMDSFDDIVGKQNVLSVHGSLHKYLKILILNLFGSESLKGRLLPDVEDMTLKHLQLWSTQTSVNLKEAIATMIFDFTAKKLFSYDESKYGKKLRESYAALLDGLISFPLNIPGTAYWKCLQGRKNAMETIKDILEERRASPRTRRQQKDFLDLVIEEMERDECILTEGTALDLLFALPFATYETTSSALTLAVQFLSSHPSVLAELIKEHDAITRERETMESGITWKEFKSMTFTIMVINETIRLGNIVPAIFRRVVKDVEVKGYTIPAGWMVMVCPTAVHMNPEKYDDPLSFNPWRGQGKETNKGSCNFMAFGGGVRLCVGAEFVKLQMAIFLHHLVTKDRWTIMKEGRTIRRPGLVFPDGFHVKISDKN
ncbi:hypothetical protein F0562_026585 [Nyssa sinensis]|uniref:Cytochrome P450 n=1 Tax=Nyssa sinensis TaxID=561372 RepID=A0A5J5B9S3_9ASTE|nr:hypothetical protein F0562_026585 [Nyssa sinensis]